MQRLFVWLCFLLGLVWTLIISAVSVPIMLVSEKTGHRCFRLFGRVWCLLLGVKIKFEGEEKLRHAGPMVLTPNHASIFDIFVAAVLPVDFKWILKRELMWIPFLGWSIWAMKNYSVRRDGSGKDLRAMKDVEKGLRAGKSVLMFPEGTRTRTGELLPFKKGAFRVAENAGVPLCPMVFVGTYEISPPGQVPSRWGHDVTVRVGTPFTVSEVGGSIAANQELRRQLTGLLSAGK